MKLGHDQITKTWMKLFGKRRSCDVIILTLILNLIITSIVDKLDGSKVTTLMFLLFASNSVCIWFKQIVNTFCNKLPPFCQHNKTPLHRWGSFKFQSRPVKCQILRLSLRLRPAYNHGLWLSGSLHLASTNLKILGHAFAVWNKFEWAQSIFLRISKNVVGHKKKKSQITSRYIFRRVQICH